MDEKDLSRKYNELVENGENSESEDPETIILTDDDGNDLEFWLLDAIPYNDEKYAVLAPKPEDEEEELQVVIMRVTVDEDGDSLESVDDDITAEAVYAIFKTRYRDEIDFED